MVFRTSLWSWALLHLLPSHTALHLQADILWTATGAARQKQASLWWRKEHLWSWDWSMPDSLHHCLLCHGFPGKCGLHPHGNCLPDRTGDTIFLNLQLWWFALWEVYLGGTHSATSLHAILIQFWSKVVLSALFRYQALVFISLHVARWVKNSCGPLSGQHNPSYTLSLSCVVAAVLGQWLWSWSVKGWLPWAVCFLLFWRDTLRARTHFFPLSSSVLLGLSTVIFCEQSAFRITWILVQPTLF